MRLRLFFVLLGAIGVVATFTYPLWYAALENTTTAVTFPGVPAHLQESFAALPQEQQAAFMAILAEDANMGAARITAALAPQSIVPEDQQEPPPLDAAQQVASGTFVQIDVIHWAQGRVVVYQRPDNSKVLRFEDFQSANAPDLRVILSTSRSPRTQEEVELNNRHIELGLLQGTIGNQNYEIPPEVDISEYNSVVIYSRSFNIVISTANI